MRTFRPLAFVLAGCPIGDNPSCTTIATYSVNVTVVDEQGAAVAEAIVSYSVDGEERGACEDIGDGSFVCGVEEAGHFVITASAQGFEARSQEVVVNENECHVLPETLEISLLSEGCPPGDQGAGIYVTLLGVEGVPLSAPVVQYRDAMIDDTAWLPCESWGDQWACAIGATGTFDVMGTADGYDTAYDLVTVELDPTGCYPEAEDITLQLELMSDC
jgi:hypothetical protein